MTRLAPNRTGLALLVGATFSAAVYGLLAFAVYAATRWGAM